MSNGSLNEWVWPLQEVRNSEWVKRVIARDGGISGIEWRHFVVASSDLCLHVMAVEAEQVEFI